MADKQTTTTAKVIPLRPSTSETSKSSEKKWGGAVMKFGFTVLPSLIFRAQARLGLTPTHLAVLLQIADYWWEHERKPYPGTTALGERLGLSPRQVRRHIAELERAGLVKRIERRAAHRGKLTNVYDLSGLVEKLKKLEPEFREVKDLKRKVSRRGGLRHNHRPQEDNKA
jgi:DNA-binding MarR family transcriptional regulator